LTGLALKKQSAEGCELAVNNVENGMQFALPAKSARILLSLEEHRLAHEQDDFSKKRAPLSNALTSRWQTRILWREKCLSPGLRRHLNAV
jgi:DNA-binding NarL/FixJ family response regulator